jgi:hypothetical protein
MAGMKLQELRDMLVNGGIAEDMYSLCGGLPNEAYCLGQTEGDWEVYYSERGLKTGLRFFADEQSACNYFAELVLADPTTRIGWPTFPKK